MTVVNVCVKNLVADALCSRDWRMDRRWGITERVSTCAGERADLIDTGEIYQLEQTGLLDGCQLFLGQSHRELDNDPAVPTRTTADNPKPLCGFHDGAGCVHPLASITVFRQVNSTAPEPPTGSIQTCGEILAPDPANGAWTGWQYDKLPENHHGDEDKKITITL
jgi:hypothetical protein